ncbi:MAG: hypothetical protein ACRCW0_08110 [Clostridium sp.]
MKTALIKPSNPAESLKQSLLEMQLMREGKMDKSSYWDAMKDLEIVENVE